MVYQFKLETILTYRRNLEDLAQQKLAAEERILQGHRDLMADYEDNRRLTAQEFDSRKQGSISGPIFGLFIDAIKGLDLQIQIQQTRVQSQEKMVEAARSELVTKVKDRKVIEKFREQDHRKYLKEMIRLEYKEIDEIAVLRNKHGGGLHNSR
ncbi:MAG: flagellar export protein FliJ [Proteobacteria bacterium]|nr:flagellar export protein FliJ [Pseudomonadota bacterium]MBU1686808.1 flagellar export protein FliJ [Pseudomonadota bacterium]